MKIKYRGKLVDISEVEEHFRHYEVIKDINTLHRGDIIKYFKVNIFDEYEYNAGGVVIYRKDNILKLRGFKDRIFWTLTCDDEVKIFRFITA